MNIHNIGFYEDLTKTIFKLSSNIIKYTPYFFCCLPMVFMAFLCFHNPTSPVMVQTDWVTVAYGS